MNKKKIIFYATLSIIFIACGLLLFQKKQELREFGKEVNQGLLKIDYLVNMDSIPISKNMPLGQKTTLLILFNAECEACHLEIKSIVNQIDKLKNISIILVSSESIAKIKSFISLYHLNDFNNVIVAKAKETDLYTIFKSYSYPSIFLYGKNGKFIASYKGNVDVNMIITDFEDVKTNEE